MRIIHSVLLVIMGVLMVLLAREINHVVAANDTLVEAIIAQGQAVQKLYVECGQGSPWALRR